MNPSELTWVLAISGILLVLAVYFGYRQWQTLRRLRDRRLAEEDYRYYHRQSVRRLFCSALMVLLASLLLGTVFLEPKLQELTPQPREHKQGDPASPEDKEFIRFFAGYWIVLLLLLFVLLAMAAVDFWAVTRFGLRQHRRLQASHRALLEEQLEQFRNRRNGDG